MKKVFVLPIIMGILAIACEKASLSNPSDQQISEPIINETSSQDGRALAYPGNQMIVYYTPGLTPAEKQQLRDQYGVSSYENCTCADPNLELWILGGPGQAPTGGTLEEKVIAASEEDDLEGSDFNPIIQHPGTNLTMAFGNANTGIGQSLMVPSNNNVTIAVIDTGVDYNYFGFTQPFLYNSPASGNACTDNGQSDFYGWDFANKDNDPYDDYGHGTIITSMISSTLETKEVDYQILPIKTFDVNGSGRYFDILCGFKYAVNNPDVDIVNMSFGWYNGSYNLLHRFIYESSQDVLVVTSAGNQQNDNDVVPHYPSSYPTPNILAVAALSAQSNIQLAEFSNYGLQSVDVAALGEHIRFFTTPQDYISVSGSSFSSAIVAANGGVLYTPGMTVSTHHAAIINEAIFDSGLSTIKYSSYVNQ